MPEFKNPNQGGGGSQDNRSFLLMMIVALGVIFGLQYWRAQKNPALESPENKAAVTAPANASGTPSSTTTSAPSTGEAKAGAAAIPAVVAAAQTSTVVENELYRITFSNQGGQVTSWILKKYKDNAGHPLDMVHDGAAKLYGYPLSLYTYDAGLNQQLASALYVPSATGTLQAPASLTFKYSQGNLSVTKTFTFSDTYVIHADTVVLRDGAPIRALVSWPAGLGDMETAMTYAGAQVDTNSSGKTDHLSFKKISGGATLNGPFDFAGVSDQYFGAVFMPDKPDDASAVTFEHKIDIAKVKPSNLKGDSMAAPASKELPVLGTAVGALSGQTGTSLFVGPKAVEVLKNIHTADGGNLEPLLDFGFFGPIGKYLFLGLRAVHSWIAPHNPVANNYSWGWAIIIFTVMINVVLLPLRIQGMKSALKMQRIQPQVDAIKAKYKNPKPTDPKAAEMNAEVMALQKANGVSMLGGCVPSLIQLPLLFAFFTMMTKVVELRQAHFFWLPDLSSADPHHILPVLMVLTSFLAQFYTPSPGVDPQQQKMMAFVMPLFSGYLTWQYASGLALYWNVGNLVMIATQLVMNQTSLGREMKEIAAKRARRKVAAPKPGQRLASGKTIQGRK